MPWSTRPITSAEKENLERRLAAAIGPSPRSGCVSNLAHYGAYLVLVPTMGGGFVAHALSEMGVSSKTDIYLGLAVAGSFGILLSVGRFVVKRREVREHTAPLADMRAAIQALDLLPVLDLAIDRIWAIADVASSEPDMPAYLLRGMEGFFVLLNSSAQLLPEPSVAKRQIRLTLLPPEKEDILEIDWSGDALAVEALHLPMPEDGLPIDGEATTLTFEELPSAWQRILSAV